MYLQLKEFILSLLPKRNIYKYEIFLRCIYYQFFRGTTYHCNVCNKGLRKFVLLKNGEKICPSCGSLPRNRRLWEILQSGFLKNNPKILDFSPSRNLYRILKKNKQISYLSSDFSGEFLAEKKYDITQLAIKDLSFDLVICYHILEHIEDDLRAMRELYRVLKIGGVCIIQTPYKKGNLYEDKTIRSPEERLKHFGQSDHVRIYSVSSLKERLIVAGFQVEVSEYNESPDNFFGFKEKEFVVFAKKISQS